ncbi:unnamed protein product [Photorhabdus laumondii subsp. laumondii TTO1]|uniref:Photorhabdus luminescens subsp. laumondii TTO1 complete genome segment 10/17 n=1 Tax=Photorhabdus laumondii subsp. laumondii (strain DSM 15139 / CIP 105565 / TT01) TaxID=243265 RepID=Q7N3L0_PHOLL|nr:unnamed protein product [Photorhabdus laumondii subsp. laumondii TTO1]
MERGKLKGVNYTGYRTGSLTTLGMLQLTLYAKPQTHRERDCYLY